MLDFFKKVPELLRLTKPKNGLHPVNGLNGYHGKLSGGAKASSSPEENGLLEKQPTLQFVEPVTKVTDSPLPIIQDVLLQVLLRKVEKYIEKHWDCAQDAFAAELAALKDLPVYAEKPSLAKNAAAVKAFQFIQTAFPQHTSKEPRDQLAIDVVNTYCENENNHRKTLFKICDIILGITTIQKYAFQLNAANNAGKKEEYDLLNGQYYCQALALHNRLATTSDSGLKGACDHLRKAIEEAYPERSQLDFPRRRTTRSCPA